VELVSGVAACLAIPRPSCVRASYLFNAPPLSLEGSNLYA